MGNCWPLLHNLFGKPKRKHTELVERFAIDDRDESDEYAEEAPSLLTPDDIRKLVTAQDVSFHEADQSLEDAAFAQALSSALRQPPPKPVRSEPSYDVDMSQRLLRKGSPTVEESLHAMDSMFAEARQDFWSDGAEPTAAEPSSEVQTPRAQDEPLAVGSALRDRKLQRMSQILKQQQQQQQQQQPSQQAAEQPVVVVAAAAAADPEVEEDSSLLRLPLSSGSQQAAGSERIVNLDSNDDLPIVFTGSTRESHPLAYLAATRAAATASAVPAATTTTATTAGRPTTPPAQEKRPAKRVDRGAVAGMNHGGDMVLILDD